ncbi:hypothetical protein KY284_029981 [Solanum tuberosum]|nr:hypothetical protein KY284_029981 [Solanum tuberosum]
MDGNGEIVQVLVAYYRNSTNLRAVETFRIASVLDLRVAIADIDAPDSRDLHGSGIDINNYKCKNEVTMEGRINAYLSCKLSREGYGGTNQRQLRQRCRWFLKNPKL